MSFRLAAGAAVAAIIALPVAAGAQVLMEPNVSAKMALTIAEAALAECGSRGSVWVAARPTLAAPYRRRSGPDELRSQRDAGRVARRVPGWCNPMHRSRYRARCRQPRALFRVSAAP